MNNFLTRPFKRLLRLVAISGFGLGLGFSVVAFQPSYSVFAQPDSIEYTQLQPSVIVNQLTGYRLVLSGSNAGRLTPFSSPQWVSANKQGEKVVWLGKESSEFTDLTLAQKVSMLATNNGVYELHVVGVETVSNLNQVASIHDFDLILVANAGPKLRVIKFGL